MEFDCTKPLGDRLEEYLASDMEDICDPYLSKGILFESQFKSIWSMVCKQTALQLKELFSKKSGSNVRYAYDTAKCNFVLYNENKYSKDEAIDATGRSFSGYIRGRRSKRWWQRRRSMKDMCSL